MTESGTQSDVAAVKAANPTVSSVTASEEPSPSKHYRKIPIAEKITTLFTVWVTHPHDWYKATVKPETTTVESVPETTVNGEIMEESLVTAEFGVHNRKVMWVCSSVVLTVSVFLIVLVFLKLREYWSCETHCYDYKTWCKKQEPWVGVDEYFTYSVPTNPEPLFRDASF